MNSYKQQVIDAIVATDLLSVEEVENLISIPQDTSKGNYTMPCFVLAKKLRKAPKVIAEDIAGQLELGSAFSKVEAVSGYLNFYINRADMMSSVIKEINVKGLSYGHAVDNGKTMVIDYSSPNIGKELAFHHMRSTMIGNALANIYKANGWNVVRINHLGDWGTQFGKLIIMYLRENLDTDEATLASLDIADLNKLYSSFSKVAKENPEMEDQAREAFAKLEQGDEFHHKLWTAFKSATLKELNRLYAMMGVRFDYYTGESFFNDKMDAVVDLLNEKMILTKSQERDVVAFEEDIPPCLIRKSDGSTLYATRDLAAAIYRKDQYDFDKCLYVVDNGQALHFKQVFKVLEMADQEWYDRMEHIPFGLILNQNEDGKWEKGKTRNGQSSLLRDVFEAAQKKILNFIDDKNPDLENKENIAMQIGISALTFNDLKNRRLMDIKFDWDKALSFEGATGPYVQNAHVRLCSIMRKAGYTVAESDVNYDNLVDDVAYELVLVLKKVSAKLEAACEANEAYIIAQYVLEIAESAHRFIHHCRVLGVKEEKDRLFLVQTTQIVMENMLSMIGVVPIKQM